MSAGFAVPYGQCPACGGKLAPLGERSIADAKALEAVRIAFEIELGGMAFYKRASTEAKDPALQVLFGKFAEMEKEHMDILSKRYHATLPTAAEDFQLDRAAIFAGVSVESGMSTDPAMRSRMCSSGSRTSTSTPSRRSSIAFATTGSTSESGCAIGLAVVVAVVMMVLL